MSRIITKRYNWSHKRKVKQYAGEKTEEMRVKKTWFWTKLRHSSNFNFICLTVSFRIRGIKFHAAFSANEKSLWQMKLSDKN